MIVFGKRKVRKKDRERLLSYESVHFAYLLNIDMVIIKEEKILG